MADYKKLAAEVIENLGGKENISYLSHCITRLRFIVKDASKINVKAIENIDGVMGYATAGEQKQVIIGAGVNSAFHAVKEIIGDSTEVDSEQIKENLDAKKPGVVNTVIEALSSIIAPVVPAFCAGGMIKVLLLLLSTLGLCTGEEGACILLGYAADAIFYFLPIAIAATSARRFKTDMGLAIIVGASLLYPDFAALVNGGEALTFLHIPVPMYSYSASIFPALLGVLFLSYVYRFFDRMIKIGTLKAILVPMLSILVAVPVTFLAIAPLATWLANGLAVIFQFLFDTVGPVAGLIIGALMPVMTLTGLHQSLTPLELTEITAFGYSRVLAIEFFHNVAEAGSALGTAVFHKDKKMKAVAAQTGVTALIGVSEPALYSVMVKEKSSMLAACAGNGIGAFLGVLLSVKGYAFVWPNIFSIPSFLGPNLVHDLICLLVCYAITFASAFLLVPVFRKIVK